MRFVPALLAMLLLVSCSADELPTTDTVPARPVVDRIDRHGHEPAGTPPTPLELPNGQLVRGHPDFLEAGEQALALIDYPWEDLGWPIHVLPPETGHLGMTLVEQQRAEVYVRPEMSQGELAAVIAHELGHVVDPTLSDDEHRARWLALRGLPADTPWWPCEGCTDYDTGAGDFAEVFAHWLVPGHFRGLLAPPPSEDDLPDLLHLLELAH